MYNEKNTKWNVLQTLTGKEQNLVNYLMTIFQGNLELFYPKRELIHINSKRPTTIYKALFPGYIFIRNDLHKVLHFLRSAQLKRSCCPVKFDDRYGFVKPEEMAIINSISDENGVVSLSKGFYVPGEKIKVVEGPLKEFKGKIIFVNVKKRKAKVELSINNKEYYVSLGFEMIGATSINGQSVYPSIPQQFPVK